MDEDVAHGHIGGSKDFEGAYHADALKHDDEQATDDSESTDENHENENHDHVHVEHGKPRKGVGGNVLDAEHTIGDSLTVGALMDELKFAGQFLNPVEIIDRHLQA